MALIPSARYPAQTDAADPDYPHGKARNAGSYQDGTGTPLERDWVNDDWGFKQALLAAGSVTPSGNADKVGASQYLDALTAVATTLATTIADARVNALAPGIASSVATPIAALKVACYTFDTGSPYALTQVFQNGGFTLEGGNTVRLPSAGTYVALAKAQFDLFTSAAGFIALYTHGTGGTSSGSFLDRALHTRVPDAALVTLSTLAAATIADPALATAKIRVTASYSASGTLSTFFGRLFVLKLA